MDVKKTRIKIKSAMSGLRVPVPLLDDAYQVGFVAELEGKPIRPAIRAWMYEETKFREKIVPNCGEGWLEDSDNHARRLSSGVPKFKAELVGDEIVAYEDI